MTESVKTLKCCTSVGGQTSGMMPVSFHGVVLVHDSLHIGTERVSMPFVSLLSRMPVVFHIKMIL